VDLDGARPGRLIDWECGDQETFERLLARLRRWNARLLCTDEYVVYEQSLSAGRHYAGKDQTVALERAHSRLRHWLVSWTPEFGQPTEAS
jgi:insertion element IS1 protein InsB